MHEQQKLQKFEFFTIRSPSLIEDQYQLVLEADSPEYSNEDEKGQEDEDNNFDDNEDEDDPHPTGKKTRKQVPWQFKTVYETLEKLIYLENGPK